MEGVWFSVMPDRCVQYTAVRLQSSVVSLRQEQDFLLKELDRGPYTDFGKAEMSKMIEHLEIACFVKLKLSDRILGIYVPRRVRSILSMQLERVERERTATGVWNQLNMTGPLSYGR